MLTLNFPLKTAYNYFWDFLHLQYLVDYLIIAMI